MSTPQTMAGYGGGPGGNLEALPIQQRELTFYGRYVKGDCKQDYALVARAGNYPLLERVNTRGKALYLGNGEYIGTSERDTSYALKHAAPPPEWRNRKGELENHISKVFLSSRSNVGHFDVRGTSDGGLLILDRDLMGFELFIVPQGKAVAALYARLLEQADPQLVEQLDTLRRAATPVNRGPNGSGASGPQPLKRP